MTKEIKVADWLPQGIVATLTACSIALTAPAMAQETYPSADDTLDWTIAFGPGGGNDISERLKRAVGACIDDLFIKKHIN